MVQCLRQCVGCLSIYFERYRALFVTQYCFTAKEFGKKARCAALLVWCAQPSLVFLADCDSVCEGLPTCDTAADVRHRDSICYNMAYGTPRRGSQPGSRPTTGAAACANVSCFFVRFCGSGAC